MLAMVLHAVPAAAHDASAYGGLFRSRSMGGAWLNAGDDVYFFCHHKNDFYAPVVARDFHRRVSRVAPLAPLPAWGRPAPAEPSQPSLF